MGGPGCCDGLASCVWGEGAVADAPVAAIVGEGEEVKGAKRAFVPWQPLAVGINRVDGGGIDASFD